MFFFLSWKRFEESSCWRLARRKRDYLWPPFRSVFSLLVLNWDSVDCSRILGVWSWAIRINISNFPRCFCTRWCLQLYPDRAQRAILLWADRTSSSRPKDLEISDPITRACLSCTCLIVLPPIWGRRTTEVGSPTCDTSVSLAGIHHIQNAWWSTREGIQDRDDQLLC